MLPCLIDGLGWLAGAVVVRGVSTLMLVHAPGVWVPVVAVLLLPSVLAIAVSCWAANLSSVLGYRLILIAIGLVLGGRL